MTENSWCSVNILEKLLLNLELKRFPVCITSQMCYFPLSSSLEEHSKHQMMEWKKAILTTAFSLFVSFFFLQAEINMLWRDQNAKIFVVHQNGSSDWEICYINVSVGQICLANPQLYCSNIVIFFISFWTVTWRKYRISSSMYIQQSIWTTSTEFTINIWEGKPGLEPTFFPVILMKDQMMIWIKN